MARLASTALATWDAVIEDPFGLEEFEHGGWVRGFDQGEDGKQIKLEEAFLASAVLMGRVTYEYFSHRVRDDEAGASRRFDELPKFVVSSTLEQPEEENTTVLRGDVVSQARMLKDQLEGDVVVPGSSRLVTALFEADLLDEIRVMIYPTVIGAGKQLLAPDAGPKPMKLARAENVGTGICYFIFEPREAGEVSEPKSYEPRII